MKIKDYDFIWSCYSSSDIESIMSDVKLSDNNYKFYFVLDTYDVVENFLPYTEMELFSKGHTNQLAQKYICYDYLFDKLTNERVLLPDEYKIELLAAKNKLQRHLKEARAVLSNIQKLKEETPDFSDFRRTNEFFKKNFEIILLLLIINNKKSKILDEFRDFVRDRLSISEIEASPQDHEQVNNIFKNTSSTTLSVEIFKQWVDINKLFLVSIEDDNHRHIFLENTFRDIQVIERLSKINKALKDNGLKYFVIYLSTAHKTPSLFKLMEERTNVKNAQNIYPANFHRNVFQYFLLRKFLTEYKHDTDKSLAILASMKTSKQRLEGFKDAQIHEIGKDALATITEMFEEASSALDNHFYFSIYQKYKGAFFLGRENSPIEPNVIQKIFQEIDNNPELITDVNSLSFTLTQVNQSLDVITILGSLERRVSKDLIRNPYQHLPVLLFRSENIKIEISRCIHDFVNTMIESGKEGESRSRHFLINEASKKLTTLISAIGTPNSARERLIRSILMSYITLFANNKNQTEEALINEFNAHLEIIQALSLNVDFNNSSSASLRFKHKPNSLALEVSYILLWLYRRNNKELDGIELGEALINSYPTDARIHHGLALCYLVKAYNQMNSLPREQVIFEFKKSERYLISALELLIEEMSSTKLESEYETELTLKTQTAILNSIANIKIRLFELSEQAEIARILEGLELITIIKELFLKLNLKYEKHATYIGTEIELLYFTALVHQKRGDILAAREAIVKSSILLSHLKNLNEYKYSDDFFRERFKKLAPLMNDLIRLK